MSLVFVSYSRKDAEFVLRLTTELKQHAVPIWLDQFDIPLGQRWDTAIEAALKSCTHVLAVLSPTSVSSQNVLDEISYAIEEKKELIPIELADCDVPFRLRRIQRRRFQDDYAAAFRLLLGALPRPSVAPRDLVDRTPPYDAQEPLIVNRQPTPVRNALDLQPMPTLEIQYGARNAYVPILHSTVIIGRGMDCDIVIRVESVSRQHVRIALVGESYYLTDLDSRNGTAINGGAINGNLPYVLRPGDTIDLGDARMKFDPERAPRPMLDRLIEDDEVETVNIATPWKPSTLKFTATDSSAITQPMPSVAKSIQLNNRDESVIVMGMTLEPGLTTAQFRFLCLLVQAQGATCTRDQIAEFVWPSTATDRVSNIVIDIVAHTVRDRLAEIDSGWSYVIGDGEHAYRFNDRPHKK